MSSRRVHSEGTYAHFVTFSCYKRRKLLTPDHCKKIVLGTLAQELRRAAGTCLGFVLMPDHVHALLWFNGENTISAFMDKWKELSSKSIESIYARQFSKYYASWDRGDTVWQDKYYGFNVYSESKLREKVEYMHANPVRANLVEEPCDWPWSSARFWYLGQSVGVPISWVQ